MPAAPHANLGRPPGPGLRQTRGREPPCTLRARPPPAAEQGKGDC